MGLKALINLSKRLKYTLEVLKISQTELARRIDVKPQVIQYLCAGNSEKSKFTLEIAEALNVDFHWLATGKGAPPEYAIAPKNKIPLLDFIQIREWYIYGKAKNETAIETYVPYEAALHNQYFAVMMNDRAMAPRFDLNTIIIIDPLIQTTDDISPAYVLVYLAEEDFIVFRQIVNRENKRWLAAINKSLHKDILFKSEDKILGICKEARWKTYTN